MSERSDNEALTGRDEAFSATRLNVESRGAKKHCLSLNDHVASFLHSEEVVIPGSLFEQSHVVGAAFASNIARIRRGEPSLSIRKPATKKKRRLQGTE